MVASVHSSPGEESEPEGLRPFDRSSLEESLAEALRAAEPRPSKPAAFPHGGGAPAPTLPAAFPTAPTLPLPVAPPPPAPRPSDRVRPFGPTAVPGSLSLPAVAPVPVEPPAPEPPAAIPSGLRLLPPPEPVELTKEVHPEPVEVEPAVAVAPWRPEDDDILPARHGRGRSRLRFRR